MTYTVQRWQGETLLCETDHDDTGARKQAGAIIAAGFTARILTKGEDRCEVWTPDGQIRRGTLAATTLVHG
jgi:hypothetical protein